MNEQQLMTVDVCDGIAVISVDSPPVNALSLKVRQGIDRSVRDAIADEQVAALVLICKGKTFFAGADIKELGAPPVSPRISELEALIEDSPKPVVAAIHGTALGGGLELALSCHYRVAVPSAKCGLTEVKLGILPAAGGTQRLPRVVGVERSLEMITTGEFVVADECLAMGLLDRLVPEGTLEQASINFAREIVEQNLPLRRVRDRDEKLAEVRGNSAVFDRFRQKNASRFKGLNAPEGCIRCIEAAVNLPFEEGLKFEKTVFAELNEGGQPAALQYAFFAERQIKKIPGIDASSTPIAFNRIGVVGAGTMGGGIAMNFANMGLPVTLLETRQEALDRGLDLIRKNYERSQKRGKLSAEDVEARMSCFTGTLSYDALADCDLVIEAVFEDMAVKKSVFQSLDQVVGPNAVLASNTSFLDIEEIASVTSRPERVVGMHFFSPANVMKLVEVVHTAKASPQVTASVMALSEKAGKVAVMVGNCYGFVGNRIVVQRKTQGQALLLEGAMPWQVDRVITDVGFPMGPFAMSDLAGLDIGWVEGESNGETIRDVLCEMGRRGQKTGAGYYDYDENRKASESALVKSIIENFISAHGLTTREISDEEILHRCVYTMINEACKILQEGIALRASDIDVIMINGYGFPRYLGGLTYYADQVGLDKVLAVMQQLYRQFGDEMKPAALLETLVAEGGKLSAYSNVK